MASIAEIVKQSRILYNAYYYVGNACIKVLRFFLKPNSKLIVFNSFGGRKYDDSPRAIYLKMIEDPRFSDYSLVWAFKDPNRFKIPKGAVVKIDTFAYYKTVLRARVWITNTTMTRALSFKGINTFYLNTWHGSAIKRIGSDAVDGKAFVSKGKNYTDVFLAQGEYDREVFSRVFGCDKDHVILTGLPRNDELIVGNMEKKRTIIREHLSIPAGKRVILYAPTFREYTRVGSDCVLSLPVNWQKWQSVLSDSYIVLMRAHPAIVNNQTIPVSDFLKDVSSYPYLNDLMIASDILISDYSSLFFDYAVLGKPMFCFAFDYEKYKKERGLYFDIRKELGNENLDTEDKLLSAILDMDEEERISVANSFRNKYVQRCGTASDDVLDLVYNAIQ